MTDLEATLRAAAEAETVAFDVTDVRRRVERRRRSRTVAGVIAVAVVFVAGFTFATRTDDDASLASES